jgi:hypothetical protein
LPLLELPCDPSWRAKRRHPEIEAIADGVRNVQNIRDAAGRRQIGGDAIARMASLRSR